MAFFSLIIPTFNEARNIVTLLDNVRNQLRFIPYEIVVVDDNSPDGTSRVVEAYFQWHPEVRLLTRLDKRGLSSAVLDGMNIAKGDVLGVMDADHSHDERLLPSFIQAIEDGADLVIGSRRIPGGGADKWPWYRRLTSSGATWLAIWWLHLAISDPMSGYFAIPRTFYDQCKTRVRPRGYKILLELYCTGKPKRVREIPFIFKDRNQGYSKFNLKVMLYFLEDLIRLRKI